MIDELRLRLIRTGCQICGLVVFKAVEDTKKQGKGKPPAPKSRSPEAKTLKTGSGFGA